MTFVPYTDHLRIAGPPSPPSVKSESSSSPLTDLSPSPLPSFSFSYPAPSLAKPRQPPPIHDTTPSLFRFGMAHTADAWSLKRHPHDPAHGQGIALDMNALSFPDEYEDADELSDLPPSATSGPSAHSAHSERIIRRRSSKACDQCRKSKCKCERALDGGACKSCIMLGTPCTFLGPSRKRGPPKGYIDAIEARLHQTEALLGILLAVEAERAEKPNNGSASGKRDLDIQEREESLESVFAILRKDTLAREILNRVNSSPYGVKGRKSGNVKARPHAHTQDNSESGIDIQSTHPSNEWQDRVTALLTSSLQSQAFSRSIQPSPSSATISTTISLNDHHPPRHLQRQHSSVQLLEGDNVRRQRRRVEGEEGDTRSSSPLGVSLARSGSTSPAYSPIRSFAPGSGYASGYMGTSTDSDSEEDVVDAVGQLSLNEDEQVRYHGKASGLYLLGINAKEEARNEGGIWRFPKARVWPPLPPSAGDVPNSPSTAIGPFLGTLSKNVSSNASTGHLPLTSTALYDDSFALLPDRAMQEHLLELYFTYVHSAFPILHKDAFWEGYRSMQNPPMDTPSPTSGGSGNSPAPLQGKRRHVSPLLLLCMFAIAARYSPSSSPPPSPRSSTPTSPRPQESAPMWTAGDDFLLRAKTLLDNTYASSMPSTVQSLLLLGYREIGIGAMAQAWVYTGMAVRMAQDLGMHRAADGWARVGMGRLFGQRELQERRRIWWGCIVLDGYVSTYIGRPLAIFEWDYDTQLPSVEESDEQGTWAPHHSLPPDTRGHGYRPGTEMVPPVPGRILSCFTASATLSTILSKIVQAIYSIRSTSSRHTESIHIEGLLDKWYFDLPEHLRFELRYDAMGNLITTSGGRIPSPQILTMHMKYWCTTLLLHRPFIRQIYLSNKHKSENADDTDARAASKKNYELCVGAANHIASIVTFYREKYCLQRAPVFLVFYAFTAAIMHVTSLSIYPDDPQARMGLTKCMDALQDMDAVWPAALRANELLRGCDPGNKGGSKNAQFGQLIARQGSGDRQKRAAEHAADSEDAYQRSHMHVPSSSGGVSLAASQPYAQPWRSTQFTPMSQETGPGQPGEFSATSSLPTGQASSYYQWPSEGASYVPFPTLSTSVLPQMYSTGLIDERRAQHALTSSQHGQTRSNGHSASGVVGGGQAGYEPTGGGRYPQFWNDFTSFPQMEMAYGQAPGAPAQGQEGIFLNGQYHRGYLWCVTRLVSTAGQD